MLPTSFLCQLSPEALKIGEGEIEEGPHPLFQTSPWCSQVLSNQPHDVRGAEDGAVSETETVPGDRYFESKKGNDAEYIRNCSSWA